VLVPPHFVVTDMNADRRHTGKSTDKSLVDGGGFAGNARREYQRQIASSGVARKSIMSDTGSFGIESIETGQPVS
jgi:hypothetical protein